MLFKNKNILGLDIGTSSIKMAQFSESKGGLELKSLAVANLPPEVVVEGEVMDSNVVTDNIRQLIKEHSIKAQNAAVAVLSRSVIIKKVKMPKMAPSELEESIHLEAEQYIPYDIDDVNIDFQIIDSEAEGDSENMEVLLVVVKKEKINDIVNLVTSCGLKPSIIDVDGFAIENQYELNSDIEEGQNVALLDIGASISNLIIIKDGLSISTNDISIGGNSYTKAIQRSFSLSFEQAEALKLGDDLEEISHDNIDPIIQEINEELANEIHGTFGYFKASYESEIISKIVLSGGGACLKGLAEFLEKRLEIPVEMANPLKNIYYNEKKFDSEYLSRIAPMLAVTTGLALRRVGDR